MLRSSTPVSHIIVDRVLVKAVGMKIGRNRGKLFKSREKRFQVGIRSESGLGKISDLFQDFVSMEISICHRVASKERMVSEQGRELSKRGRRLRGLKVFRSHKKAFFRRTVTHVHKVVAQIHYFLCDHIVLSLGLKGVSQQSCFPP